MQSNHGPGCRRTVVCFLALCGLAASQTAGFDALLQQGLEALSRGELQAAAGALEEARKLRSSDARVWLGLAQAYRKLGRVQAAEGAAAQAARLAPDDPRVLHSLALFYSEAGFWNRAAEFEGRYAERAATDPAAYARAAAFALEAGQTAKAIAALREAVRLSPYEETYHFQLGRAMLIAQDFGGAVNVLEKGRAVFDKSPQIELALGVAYYGQRRFSEAIDAFLKTIFLAPEVEQPYIFLGRILEQAGDRLAEITGKFSAFAAAHPQNPLGPLLHAKALMAQMGPTPRPELANQAESLLRHSIALKEELWESHFALGVLCEERRLFTQAERELERAIQLNPASAAAHYRLARVYERLDKPRLAAAERALHQKLADAERAAGALASASGGKGLDAVVK